jgi:N-acetylglucosaminyldiphosphoundecaprenol N-acetyl-beta-D-mannosaminyltransferase
VDRIRCWGIWIDNYSCQETIELIVDNIRNRTLCKHIVVNAAKIVHAQENRHLLDSINNSDIINVDGMAVMWALRALRFKVPERVSGIDLFIKLLEICEEEGFKPFFLGAEESVLDGMIKNISQKYPGLFVAGKRNGYYESVQEQEIIAQIKNSNADMLFIGMGSPQKEIFIENYSSKINVPFVMGVGGSFDILSGKTQRAPLSMQNMGLEWLYRVYQEPRRMWKRYATTNTIFIWLFIKALIKSKGKILWKR